MVQNNYSKITPEIEKLSKICKSNTIDSELYTKFDVKRGLRDINGKGVLTGLTRISEINASKIVDGKSVPCDGELFYRGINVKELIAGQPKEMHWGFEEATYLLLFGKLPTIDELNEFNRKGAVVTGDSGMKWTTAGVKGDEIKEIKKRPSVFIYIVCLRLFQTLKFQFPFI